MSACMIIGATGAALALVAGGTAAGAAIAGGPVRAGVIHGCYVTTPSKGSHALVLQDAGTACPAGDTAVKWNQTGPPGPPGTANVDRGYVTWSNGGAPGETCTLAQVAGPDAASITVTGVQAVANACEIDGLQSGSVVSASGFGAFAESAGLLDMAGGSLQVWTSGSTGRFSFIAIPGS